MVKEIPISWDGDVEMPKYDFNPPAQPLRNNYYEAGMPLISTTDSWKPSIIQDARFDQNFVTRRELMRQARWLTQNNAFIERILHVDRVFTVGANGLHTSSASKDVEWGKRANDVFYEMCLTGGFDEEDIASMLGVGHHCERQDGEWFALKTFRKMSDREIQTRGQIGGSRPVIQGIEAHRVQTPFGRWNEDGDTIIDGVEIAKEILPNGVMARRKFGFWVQDAFGMYDFNQNWHLIPKQWICQIGEAQRENQIRYISAFYPMMKICSDFSDLQKLEMLAAKDGAEKSTVIKTPTGEINATSFSQVVRDRANGKASVGETQEQLEKRNNFYQRILGGRTIAVKTGDEVQQYLNNRPTPASQEYWMFLISVICAGLGVSVLLVFPDFSGNEQGTAIRSELDIANELFIARGRKWRLFMADLWQYFIGWAIYNDKRVIDPPDDWRKCKVFPPRHVNVDPGRQMQSAIQQIAAGMGDYNAWYGSLGGDWREAFDRLAEQQAYAKKIGLELQMSPNSQPQGGGDDQTPSPAKPQPKKKSNQIAEVAV